LTFVVDPLVNVLGNSNTFITGAIASDGGITYKKLNKTNTEAVITKTNNNNLNNANGSCNGRNNVGKSPGRGNSINFMSGKKLVKTQIKFNEVRL